MLIRTVCILQVSPVVEAWSPTWLHATQKLRELSQRSPRLADCVRRSSLHRFPCFFSRETRTRRPCNRITGHRYRVNKNCPGLVKPAYQSSAKSLGIDVPTIEVVLNSVNDATQIVGYAWLISSYSWDATFETAFSQLRKRAQLLHRIDTGAEAGLIARGGVHVQRALLDCLVERGHRLAVGLFGGLFVALFNGLSQAAQGSAQTGGIGAIGGRALRGLTGALKRRKMICHV